MSEINQDQTSPALGSLESLLLGSLNANQNSDQDSDQDSESDDFSRLQEMLVDPEVLRMRERMSNVEHYIPEIEKLRERLDLIEKKYVDKEFEASLEIRKKLEKIETNVKKVTKIEGYFDQPKDLIKLFLPIMSKIMNRQLNEFKKEIVQALVPIIKESQEEHRKLSIRVVGVNPETEDNLNN